MLVAADQRAEALEACEPRLALEPCGNAARQRGLEVLVAADQRAEALEAREPRLALELGGDAVRQRGSQIAMAHEGAESKEIPEPCVVPQPHLDAADALHDVQRGAATTRVFQATQVCGSLGAELHVAENPDFDAAGQRRIVHRNPERVEHRARLRAWVGGLRAHFEVRGVGDLGGNRCDVAAQTNQACHIRKLELTVRLGDVLRHAAAMPVPFVVLEQYQPTRRVDHAPIR